MLSYKFLKVVDTHTVVDSINMSQCFTTLRSDLSSSYNPVERRDRKDVFRWIRTLPFTLSLSLVISVSFLYSPSVLLSSLLHWFALFLIYGSWCSADVRILESGRLQLDSTPYSIRQTILSILSVQMDNEGACKHSRCCSIELQFGLYVGVIIMTQNGNHAWCSAALL